LEKQKKIAKKINYEMSIAELSFIQAHDEKIAGGNIIEKH